MYKNGQGVTQDSKEAVEWIRQAADQGDAAAHCSSGSMYKNEEGVTQDSKEAVKWFRQAADKGNADAQCSLGLMYENGGEVITPLPDFNVATILVVVFSNRKGIPPCLNGFILFCFVPQLNPRRT
jgi:TPR repeat protein